MVQPCIAKSLCQLLMWSDPFSNPKSFCLSNFFSKILNRHLFGLGRHFWISAPTRLNPRYMRSTVFETPSNARFYGIVLFGKYIDTQSMLWCHLALDHLVNKTKHVDVRTVTSQEALKVVKICTDFKASVVYGVILWIIFTFFVM